MKKKLIALFIIVVILAIFFSLTLHRKEKTKENEIILNEYQIESYLNLKGYEVSKIDTEEIRIPENFSDFYKNIVDLLKTNGFNIDFYKGQNAIRYTYKLENYNTENIIAEILVTSDGNKLISALLIEQSPNGFIKPI